MSNPLFIEDVGTLHDKVNACIRVLNVITNKMFVTTIPQATADISKLSATTGKLVSDIDISISTLLQNGLVNAEDIEKIFTAWLVDFDYKAGDIVVYGNVVYECLQGHHTQETWTPDVSPSLWKKLYTVKTNEN